MQLRQAPQKSIHIRCPSSPSKTNHLPHFHSNNPQIVMQLNCKVYFLIHTDDSCYLVIYTIWWFTVSPESEGIDALSLSFLFWDPGWQNFLKYWQSVAEGTVPSGETALAQPGCATHHLCPQLGGQCWSRSPTEQQNPGNVTPPRAQKGELRREKEYLANSTKVNLGSGFGRWAQMLVLPVASRVLWTSHFLNS